MRLRFPHACHLGCELCAGTLVLDVAGSDAMLDHAANTGQRRVYLHGAALATNPVLAAVVQAARRRGLHVALIEDDPRLHLATRVRELQAMGVGSIYVTFGDAVASGADAPGKTPDARKQALTALLALPRDGNIAVGIHILLNAHSVDELPRILRLLMRGAIRELLLSEAPGEPGVAEPLPPATLVAALERTWRAASAARVRLRFIGFERARFVDSPATDPPATCDEALVGLIRARLPLPCARDGVRALGAPDALPGTTQAHGVGELRTLAFELAARRSPFIDLPPCLGGTDLDRPATEAGQFVKSSACPACAFDPRCRGASTRTPAAGSSVQSALRPLPTWYAFPQPPRVVVLSSIGGDGLFYISTLPALAHALRQRGAEVEIVSPWASRWDPQALPRLDHDRAATTWMGTADVEAWLAARDLREVDLVIASDFAVARLAWAAGSLGADARMVVVDSHMLETMQMAVDTWAPPGVRAAAGGWWPSDQLLIESAFPAHVQLYLNYGVPLEQIAWRPFALCQAHFPPGPNVGDCSAIFSGGQHLRDVPTLSAATERLSSSVHAVDLYAFDDHVEANPHLHHRGSVSVERFYRALANSRFVVLPLRDDDNCAAGVTVLAMALMAGRPVVATGTAAIRDYVEHGVEALLVPPGDPAALADAISQLDTDHALLARLAAAARETGRRLSTEHWADQIIAGTRPVPIRRSRGWRNW
jgi:hypothetical protein